MLPLPCDFDALFDRSRVLAYCRILLAVETAVFLWLIAGTHSLIVPLPEPASTDFVSFYAAGTLADAGTPQLAYDQLTHYAAEVRATAAGVEYRFFYYPPPFLLLCAALARLPYLAAFVLFEAATLALCLLVLRAILRERGPGIVAPLLAFPAVFWTLGLGQNAFLTAALLGAGTLWIDRRPVVAGLAFGALCYKPHLGLLVPVALLAGRHWRALGAGLASAAVLCMLSLVVFGWETWRGFFAVAAGSHASYESGRIALGGMVSPFAAALLLGASPTVAYSAQIAVTLTAALLVGVVWRRGGALPTRAAVLAAATLVAVPVILIYDLMLAAVAAVWLIHDKRPPAGWEKALLAAAFVLCLDPRGLTAASGVPIAPLVAMAVLGLAASRAFPAPDPGLAGPANGRGPTRIRAGEEPDRLYDPAPAPTCESV